MKFLATALTLGLGIALVGCGDNQPESQNIVDTREVKKQAEPQAPSLSQRIESPVISEPVQEVTPPPVITEVKMQPQMASGASAYNSCAGCHGMQGDGGVGPKLKGQSEEDLISKMILYRAGEQVGPMTGMMAPMVKDMSDEDIERIVKFILTF